MSDKLLPCPFCGSHAELIYDDAWYFVHCQGDKCEAETDGWKVAPLAVAAWNRRPAPSGLSAEEQEALRISESGDPSTYIPKSCAKVLAACVRRLAAPADGGSAGYCPGCHKARPEMMCHELCPTKTATPRRDEAVYRLVEAAKKWSEAAVQREVTDEWTGIVAGLHAAVAALAKAGGK